MANVDGGLELDKYQVAKIGPGKSHQGILNIGVILWAKGHLHGL